MKTVMKKMIALAGCVTVALLSAAEITLFCGQHETISRPYTFRYRLEGAPVIRAEGTGRNTEVCVVAGDAAGVATVVLVRQNGAQERIQVKVLDATGRYRLALAEAIQQRGFSVVMRERDGALIGSVTSSEDWRAVRQLNEMLAEQYGVMPVSNFVKLDTAAAANKIRTILQEMGYVIVPSVSAKSKVNEIAVLEQEGAIVLSGKTYSDAALKAITDAVAAVPVQCQNNVMVDKHIRLVMTAWLLMTTDGQDESYGTVSNLSVGSVVNLVWNRNTGSSSHGYGGTNPKLGGTGNTTFSGTVGANTSDFYIGESMSRKMKEVTILFVNHSDKDAIGNVGGSMYVNSGGNTEDSEDDSGLEAVNYGFTITVKGGLETPDRVLMETFSVTSNDPPAELGGSAYISGGNISLDSPNMPLDIGKTIVLVNNKDRKVDWTEPSGVPIIRHIPLIGRFFSKEEHHTQDITMLVLGQVDFASDEAIQLQRTNDADEVIHKVESKLNEQ